MQTDTIDKINHSEHKTVLVITTEIKSKPKYLFPAFHNSFPLNKLIYITVYAYYLYASTK